MKKTLVAAILGLAAATSVFAQGFVKFNNYGFTTDAIVTYGAGSGGTVGSGIDSTFSAGLYYAFGNVSFNDVTGTADPTTAGFTLAAATSGFASPAVSGAAGYFNGGIASIPGYLDTTGPITFVVVAYNGANYGSSSVVGHSQAFTLNSIATGVGTPPEFGSALTSFQVFQAVPEPSTFALAGLGLAGLLIFRRRK